MTNPSTDVDVILRSAALENSRAISKSSGGYRVSLSWILLQIGGCCVTIGEIPPIGHLQQGEVAYIERPREVHRFRGKVIDHVNIVVEGVFYHLPRNIRGMTIHNKTP